jgi:hypothetical protein
MMAIARNAYDISVYELRMLIAMDGKCWLDWGRARLLAHKRADEIKAGAET